MASEDEGEYIIPLKDQSVFGAGIKRNKINFVPPRGHEQSHAADSRIQGAGDRYLSIVLKKGSTASDSEMHKVQAPSNLQNHDTAICEICKLPLSNKDSEAEFESSKPHETSLAHQVCLEHSHTPSHLDRTRQGLKYLSSYGWDPDARLGLGATGTGIRIPIKPKPKNDTVGLGHVPPSPSNRISKPALKKLDAKETRKAEEEAGKERQRLRNMFYEHEDVERYLGSGG